MARSDEKIWIIGGSSGIGLALAQAYADRGAHVLISGRKAEALDEAVVDIGANATGAVADVIDLESLNAAAKAHGPFDRVINAAAIYDPSPVLQADQKKAEAIYEVNLVGSFNAARVGAANLRKGGQLALFGSAAAIFGLPQGQVYSSTKAAIVNLAQSLRVELAPDVDVRLITPGFVKTPLTDQNNFQMPGIMEPEEAARRIIKGLDGKAFDVAFPRRLIWPLRLLSALPKPLAFALTSRLKQ